MPRTLRLACLDGDLSAIVPQETAYAEARRTGATVDEVTDAEALDVVSDALETAGIEYAVDPDPALVRIRILGPDLDVEEELVVARLDADGFVTLLDHPHGSWDHPRTVTSVALAEGVDGIRASLVNGLELR